MIDSLLVVLQVVVALGLLNVWLLRNQKSTDYRGKDSKNLKEEFKAYGLPEAAYYVVGTLKIVSAILLLVGVVVKSLVPIAAGIIVVLMLGALSMHIKVSDPLKKSIPALLMLLMSSLILAGSTALI